jgi:hypothetical protein
LAYLELAIVAEGRGRRGPPAAAGLAGTELFAPETRRGDTDEEEPVMQRDVSETRGELEGRLINRAWKDAAFRRALLEDPKGTLERELGVNVPAGVRLTVLEETTAERYLVLPPAPMAVGGTLSDQELDAVAGGYDPPPNTDWPQVGCPQQNSIPTWNVGNCI